jgi:hypothetical protein
MVVHFRPTLDLLGEAQRRVLAAPLGELLRPSVTFLSVTEAGMYQVAGQLAKAALARGGSVGDAEYEAEAARGSGRSGRARTCSGGCTRRSRRRCRTCASTR